MTCPGGPEATLSRGRAGLHRIAVRTHPAIPRVVLDQQSHSAADDGSKTTKQKVSLAPSHSIDEERGEWRHDKRANANAADGKSGRKPATPDEPALHRAQGRNVGAADAQSDAKPVGRIDFCQTARRARDRQAYPGQYHSGNGKATGTLSIGERAAQDPQAEVQKSGQRENQRTEPREAPKSCCRDTTKALKV
jgi:hypothetical protein